MLNTSSNKGFTIIEIAVVLIIGGLLIASFSSGLIIYLEQAKIKTTQDRLQAIHDAIYTFQSANLRLPCVADPTIGVDLSGFGREVHLVVPLAEAQPQCNNVDGGESGALVLNNAAVHGFAGTPAPDSVPGQVIVGSVPVRSLNLPDEYILDAWGRRFTYVVTADLASFSTTSSSSLYNPQFGIIDVVDSQGNPITVTYGGVNDPNAVANGGTNTLPLVPFSNGVGTAPGGAEFVIVSHGPNGVGGATLGNAAAAPNVVQPCIIGAGATLESENCDGDHVFMRTLITARVGAADPNLFDDYLKINSLGATTGVPRGTVIAYDPATGGVNTCPSGYRRFDEGTGRVIVGSALAGTSQDDPDGIPDVADVGEAPDPDGGDLFEANETGGFYESNIEDSHIPNHAHNISINIANAAGTNTNSIAPGNGIIGGASTNATVNGGAGAGDAYPTMPPYIALMLCVKQ